MTKIIKFTPENLQKHLKWDGLLIVTTRDKPKGNVGDEFYIEGVGRYILTKVKPLYKFELLLSQIWKKEGFDNHDEFITELTRIYPNTELFYVHLLIWSEVCLE